MSAPSTNGGVSANPATGSKQLKSSNSGKALDGARRQAASPVEGQTKKQHITNFWQNGSNPMTSRNSSTTPNGTEKPLPKPPSLGQQLKSSTDLNADKHMHDRSTFLLAQFVGKDATITLNNGEQFRGVFSSASLQNTKTQYVIKMAQRIAPASDGQTNGTSQHEPELVGEGSEHILAIDIEDTMDVFVQDVSMAAVASRQNGSIGSSFRTDTQISARESDMFRARELHRFDLGADSSIDMSLGSISTLGPYDQFAANESIFGVTSDYNEETYTTALNRNDPKFSQKYADAERIAREIEESTSANSHVQDERRQDGVHDGEEDDEEKYSGVRREPSQLPKRGPDSYIPPLQRQMTGAPTVSGAPFDPAIISAQVKTTVPAAAIPDPIPAPHVEATKQHLAPQVDGAASAAPPVAKKGTTEDRVRDTADAFKHFANTEKLKIRQAQESKRANQRQEKNVKLNDLKKFAENFKLKSRVPDDLVPILAKDAEKQAEIKLKAEQAAKEVEVRAKDKTNDKASSAASPAPSSSISNAGGPNQANFNSQSRPRVSGNMAGLPLRPNGPVMSPHGPNNQRMHNQFGGMPLQRPQPLPADMRMPAAPSAGAENPLSPGTRLNVKAQAFRPSAAEFTPTGTTPSPQRKTSAAALPAETTVSFFKDKVKDVKEFKSFNPIERLAKKDFTEVEKKKYASNGGVPQAYNTPPTWHHSLPNQVSQYQTLFPKPPSRSQGPSPMQTPNPNGQMPHAHQLPPHMQPSTMSTPTHRPFYPAHHGPNFDPRFQQQLGPNGSVQSSPRVQQVSAAPFNGQMPPMNMMSGPPMPGYGMSPSMQYRQPSLQGGPPMMMPGQMQGQMGPMQPGFPPGSQFRGGPQMGGHMMVQNPSQGYMNGPVSNQNYTPMPPHAQPHMPHMQHGPGGYPNNSPRPPMMQPGGSHQGFQPGMPMQPNFAPSPGQPHPYHLQQQRAISGGLHHMTPRQQHAMPNHGSPGMGVPPQGDEGK